MCMLSKLKLEKNYTLIFSVRAPTKNRTSRDPPVSQHQRTNPVPLSCSKMLIKYNQRIPTFHWTKRIVSQIQMDHRLLIPWTTIQLKCPKVLLVLTRNWEYLGRVRRKEPWRIFSGLSPLLTKDRPRQFLSRKNWWLNLPSWFWETKSRKKASNLRSWARAASMETNKTS